MFIPVAYSLDISEWLECVLRVTIAEKGASIKYMMPRGQGGVGL